MIRILGCTFIAIVVGGPVALLWWGFDDDGSFPFSLLTIIWFVAFVLWPEPRRVRRRTARMTAR